MFSGTMSLSSVRKPLPDCPSNLDFVDIEEELPEYMDVFSGEYQSEERYFVQVDGRDIHGYDEELTTEEDAVQYAQNKLLEE